MSSDVDTLKGDQKVFGVIRFYSYGIAYQQIEVTIDNGVNKISYAVAKMQCALSVSYCTLAKQYRVQISDVTLFQSVSAETAVLGARQGRGCMHLGPKEVSLTVCMTACLIRRLNPNGWKPNRRGDWTAKSLLAEAVADVVQSRLTGQQTTCSWCSWRK